MIFELLKRILRTYRSRWQHPQAQIYSGAFVDSNSNIENNVVLFSNVTVMDSKVERYSYVQSGTSIFNAWIGPFCSIAGDVRIGLARHPLDLISTNPVFYDTRQPLPAFLTSKNLFSDTLPRTIIGADVFIGQGAYIIAGRNIGVGAVVGAGAVVTHDVPPYAIVVGVPAKIISWRFSPNLRALMLSSCWWERSEDELKQLSAYFDSPEKFIAQLRHTRAKDDGVD